ncbi:hypothetical protein [Halostella litorea]|uniref:hypothetical protein n=1 Tax=Halostella litorea TaxID=2528831 RepID=UPI00109279ED|nr:hypothetical protein [Halostella litorea]
MSVSLTPDDDLERSHADILGAAREQDELYMEFELADEAGVYGITGTVEDVKHSNTNDGDTRETRVTIDVEGHPRFRRVMCWVRSDYGSDHKRVVDTLDAMERALPDWESYDLAAVTTAEIDRPRLPQDAHIQTEDGYGLDAWFDPEPNDESVDVELMERVDADGPHVDVSLHRDETIIEAGVSWEGGLGVGAAVMDAESHEDLVLLSCKRADERSDAPYVFLADHDEYDFAIELRRVEVSDA